MPGRARAAAVVSLAAVVVAAVAAGAVAKPRDRREACGHGGAARRGDEVPPPLRKALLARLEAVLRQTARAFRGGGGAAFLRVPPDLARAVIRHFAWLYRAVILRAAERLLAAARSAWRAGPESRPPEREQELEHKRSRRRDLDSTVRGLRINEAPRSVGSEEFGPLRAREGESEDDDDNDDNEPPELAPIRDDDLFGADDATELPAERLSPAVKQAFDAVNGSPDRNSASSEMT